jgi:hypothetical protein
MFNGYRGFILAFGLILTAASPPQGTNGQQKQRTAQANIEQSLADITTALNEANKPSDLDKPCKQGEDNRASDLCAQWKAADAAQSSTEATWLFGTMGTLIGLLTLAAAAGAAFYAKRAADETKTANDLFREQARAKLVSRDTKFEMQRAAQSETKWPATLSFEIDNVGDTAAHKIKCIATCYLYANRMRINRMRRTVFSGTLKAGTTEQVTIHLGVAKEDFDVVSKNTANRVLVHMVRTFEDIFGNQHRDEFWINALTRQRPIKEHDHLATDFKPIDADFIKRTNYIRFPKRTRKELMNTANDDTRHHEGD